jgi:hydroxyacylglutathione hydrolase
MNKDEDELIIKRLVSRESEENQYLLISGDDAASIDIAEAYVDVVHTLSERGASLKYVLLTHARKSTVNAVPLLKENLGGTFCLHKLEYELLKELDGELEPDMLVKDNATLKLGSVDIKVLHTPGHTEGSMCFYVKRADVLFSGCTLLKGGYGRIWGTNSMRLMMFSLKRLNTSIYSEAKIYPGCGELTTMGKESWLNCLRSA